MGRNPEAKARFALRDATRDVHERLHAAAPFMALARGELSMGGYGDLLGTLGEYYASLTGTLAIEPARLRLIEQDLADLGRSSPARRCAWAMPRCAHTALGWRYVVEGSVFGGRVIYRQLDYLFGAEPRGRRFFLGTPSSPDRWANLCAELEQAASTSGSIECMVKGAHDAFAGFEALICPRVPVNV